MSRPLRNPWLEERLRQSEEDSRRIYKESADVGGRVADVTKRIEDSDDGVITIAIENEDSLVVHVDDVINGGMRGRA